LFISLFIYFLCLSVSYYPLVTFSFFYSLHFPVAVIPFLAFVFLFPTFFRFHLFPLHLKLLVVNLLPPTFFPSLVFYSRFQRPYLLFTHTTFAFLKYCFSFFINCIAICVFMSVFSSRQVRQR